MTMHAPLPPGAIAPASAAAAPQALPLIEVDGLVRHYRLGSGRLFGPAPRLRAVDGVSFSIHAGQSLGIVGESGSGKSTLARLAMGLEPPDSGRIWWQGQLLSSLPEPALRAARRHYQMVFQDPFGSLDPRLRIRDIVAEPLMAQARGRTRIERATHIQPDIQPDIRPDPQPDPQPDRRTDSGPAWMHQVLQALQAVGLGAADLDKFPHEFSGGQRQRIAIARALVTRPALIVADEPVSALDVSVQAQVLNLLQSLAQTHGLSYLLISHDLAVVERLCSQLAVMYRGRFVEQGPTRTVLAAPAHPYTRRLIEAAPRLDGHGHGRMAGQRPVHRSAPGPGAAEIEGNPQGQHAPGGCYYASCCTAADSRCRGEQPPWTDLGQGHRVACHHPLVLPFSTP